MNNLRILETIVTTQKTYVTVDAGSTGTRVSVGTTPDTIDCNYELQSEHGLYIPTSRPLEPISDKLEDNLHIRMDSKVYTGDLLFGTLKDMEYCVKRTLNGDNKCTSEVVHINTLVNIATALLSYDNNNNVLYNIEMISAFRPKDLNIPSNFQAYQEALEGKHTIEFPLLGKVITLQISNIYKFTEPSATAFNVRKNHPQGNTFRNMIIVDGGGSSIDTITVLGASVYESKASNTKTGGDDLKQKFEQVVARKLGFDPTTAQMNEALTSGKITAGSKVYDVSDMHTMLHRNLTDVVIREIQGQLNATEQTINTIDVIVLTGRLFSSSPTLKTVVDYLSDKYKNIDGLTITHIEDVYSISKGAYTVLPRLLQTK